MARLTFTLAVDSVLRFIERCEEIERKMFRTGECPAEKHSCYCRYDYKIYKYGIFLLTSNYTSFASPEQTTDTLYIYTFNRGWIMIRDVRVSNLTHPYDPTNLIHRLGKPNIEIIMHYGDIAVMEIVTPVAHEWRYSVVLSELMDVLCKEFKKDYYVTEEIISRLGKEAELPPTVEKIIASIKRKS